MQAGNPSAPAFRFIDLFAGIGGLRMGFEAVGGECVFTSEWDRFARETYRANFGTSHTVRGDIREVEDDDIPPHDVLVAGFPCQPFSLAGVSKKRSLGRAHGFEDRTQGSLFFEVARILAAHRPAAFVLENVKHLINHDRGRTFQVILETLESDLEYHVKWGVIDSRGFVPQGRERIFLVGFSSSSGFDFDTDVVVPPSEDGPRLGSVLHPEDGTEDPEEPYTEGPLARVAPRYVLSDSLWRYLQDYAERHRRKGNGFGFGLVGPDDVARTLSARYHKDGSEILVRRPRGNPRRLTPRECARLMGFDRPERRFHIPVSDTQAYRQFGNAVVVPVARAIARGVAMRLPEPTGTPATHGEMAHAG